MGNYPELIHISQVKPEFRSIVVSAYRVDSELCLVGVVFRGKTILEDVISYCSNRSLDEAVSEMVTGSKHWGQIRVIFLNEDLLPDLVSPEKIWEMTKKPVMFLSDSLEYDSRHSIEYGGRRVHAAGIDENSARRVLDNILGNSGGELIRIAGILQEALLGLHNV